MVIKCPHCSFSNPPGMRFCGNCGARLETTAQLSTSELRRGSGLLGNSATNKSQDTPVESVSPDQLGVMMGADLLERFQKAGLEASGQKRNVTILFVDLTGFTNLAENLNNEDLFILIQQLIRTLADDVYQYEGMVDKLTGDGLMAIFGAPIAHENNAERAIRAALDMQDDVFEISRNLHEKVKLDLQIHIGLNSGSVVVGGVGSNALMNYTAIGDIVNMAKRLEESAKPGTILVSESVYRQTRPLFDFQTLPPLGLKGISLPVTAYQLAGPRKKPGFMRGVEGLHSPLIGRDDEMSQLSHAIDRLTLDQQGCLIFLVGEAGLGKSRLTEEFKAKLVPDSVKTLEGHSLTYRKAIPFWIYQDLIRNLIGAALNEKKAELHSRLSKEVNVILGSKASDSLPYLEHLLSLEPTDTVAAEKIRFLDAGQLRQQTFLAVRDLFIGITNKNPLLLILEDLHWADETSLELTNYLIDSLRHAPILILAITRPFEKGDLSKIEEYARQRLVDRFISIQLKALGPDQSVQLFQSLLTIPELPDVFKEQIINRAAGIPFYLEEILRMLIEDNVIVRENDRWILSPGGLNKDFGVPVTLQDLILARFDRLTPFSRQVLQISSVIGHQFGADVLQAVLPAVSKEDTQLALEALVEREYIYPQSSQKLANPESIYFFKHVLVSDAIYGTLLQRDRQELHGRVGQAIEILYANRLEGQVELLANHYLRSLMLDRALIYLILSGQNAARGYANEQARQHFVQALSLLPRVNHSVEQIQEIHIGLGDVLVTIGEYQSARDHYQTALDAIESEGASSAEKPRWQEKSILYRKIATTFERQGEYDKTMVKLSAAREAIGKLPAPPPGEIARILNDIGWIYFRRGNLDQAEATLQEALLLSEKTSEIDVVASINNRLGGVAYQKGQLDQSNIYTHKSLKLREKIGDIVAVARSYNNLGLLDWKLGDWDGALNNFNHSLMLHSNLGDVEGMLELNTNLGLLQLDRGNIDQARRKLEDILSTAQSIGHLYTIGMAELHLSLLYLAIEEWQTALDYSLSSLQNFRDIGANDSLIDVYLNAGQACLGMDDLDSAQKWAEESRLLLNHHGRQKLSDATEQDGRIDRLLGGIALKRGDIENANYYLDRSAKIFTRVGNQYEHARSLSVMATLPVIDGDQDKANKLAETARSIFAKLGANLDLRRLEKIVC